MPKKVYCNIAKYRVLDTIGNNQMEIEDVTKIGLPTIKHTIINVKSAGMSMDVDMPDTTHLDAMEFTLYHNNGVNCNQLINPGRHVIEGRFAVQRYDVPQGDIGHEGAKFIITCAHTETQKGDLETGNPYGSTEKYSILRYEEELNGKKIVIIDAMTGQLQFNGKNYTDEVDNLLK